MREMYPKNGRVILHVDMNSFYASVEAAHDPSLRGKPLAIAGNEKERKGIIVTCSYEARAKGVRATMPLWEAKRLCPDLLVRRPDFALYRQASYELFSLLGQFTEQLEPVSIDEGYLDITDCHHIGSPLQIARQIQQEVLEQLQLPCSIGIAPNKFLAKTASDMKKPLGITVLRKRDVQALLWPLPVIEMHGVGRKTSEKLGAGGIHTIGELAAAEEGLLRELLGITGPVLKQRANGIDGRPVDPHALLDYKTIGNSVTLPADTTEETDILQVLEGLSRSVSGRLKKRKLVTYNIQITMRYDTRQSVTRSRKLTQPLCEQRDIFAAASRLWRQHWEGDPIRLLGVTACDLEEQAATTKQLDLFSFQEDAKEEPLLQVLDRLKQKYGEDAVCRGGWQEPEELSFQELLRKRYE
ncbi:DNA polymerase IV [Ectobacillus ponti]|uniref:DNA polymerase IV n=1 Tax=Ectobacillus ponti TaxID=2961894 RepID=UPI003F67BAC1